MLSRLTLAVVLLFLVTPVTLAMPSKGKTPTLSDYYFRGLSEECRLSLNGPIEELTLALIPQLNDCAAQNKRIYLDIDSPGGFVFVALQIMDTIDQIEASGLRVTCTVTRQAASAGWLVFNSCNDRRAKDTAMFMWHSVAVGLMGSYNILDLTQILSSMTAMQVWFNKLLQENLKLDERLFTQLWMTQTTLNALDLANMSPSYMEIVK